jgi:hypothetical protein
MVDPDAALKAWLTQAQNRPAHQIDSMDIDDRRITARMRDGRVLIVPLSLYPALRDAAPEDRGHFHLSAGGFAVMWPALDYDLEGWAFSNGLREAKRYAEWRKTHPIPELPCDFCAPQANKTSHNPRRTKRAASLSSAALPGRRKRKPAASRTKSVASRTTKSGLKKKR